MPDRTVATLVPSATDLVCALGGADRIVGISHECDHPAATGRPILTRANLATAPAPGEAAVDPAALDADVASAHAAGDPLYVTDRALLHQLRPDVVLAQDVCDVCAVTGDQVACEVPAGTEVVRLGAVDLDGLRSDLRLVGEALGAPDAAAEAIAVLDEGLAVVRARVADLPRPTVLLLEWSDPPFVAGHWIPELLAHAGGLDVLGSPGAASRRVTWDEIATADPDVVVFLPCGYGIDAAVAEGTALLGRPDVAGLRAVAEGRAWAVDATRLLSRCTPVAAEAAAVLASILHPGALGPPDPADARPLTP
jgi:iron complex transport system substrate-binding protein